MSKNRRKRCQDCGKPHCTGSLIWFECPKDGRLRMAWEECDQNKKELPHAIPNTTNIGYEIEKKEKQK